MYYIKKGIFYTVEFIKTCIFIALMLTVLFAITRCTSSKNIAKTATESKVTEISIDTSRINTNTITNAIINSDEYEVVNQTTDTYTPVIVPTADKKNDTTIIVKGQTHTYTIKTKKQTENKNITEAKTEQKGVSENKQTENKAETYNKQVERVTIWDFALPVIIVLGVIAIILIIIRYRMKLYAFYNRIKNNK